MFTTPYNVLRACTLCDPGECPMFVAGASSTHWVCQGCRQIMAMRTVSTWCVFVCMQFPLISTLIQFCMSLPTHRFIQTCLIPILSGTWKPAWRNATQRVLRGVFVDVTRWAPNRVQRSHLYAHSFTCPSHAIHIPSLIRPEIIYANWSGLASKHNRRITPVDHGRVFGRDANRAFCSKKQQISLRKHLNKSIMTDK